MSSENSASGRIKSAASLLLKGGTLTSEACPKCGGVQVRFADNNTCINCGNEAEAGATQEELQKVAPAQGSTGLTSVAALIEEKIAIIAAEIRAEGDVSMQKQKVELLDAYLRILERTRNLLR